MRQPIDSNIEGSQATSALSREERLVRLKIWMLEHGYKSKDLAREIGVSPSMLTRILAGERSPRSRLDSLKRLGVPAELLPPPSSGKVGRPRKASGQVPEKQEEAITSENCPGKED